MRQKYVIIVACGPVYQHGLTVIPEWINKYIHDKVWDEITYPFQNFNSATVEVSKWIINFVPRISGHVIAYLCRD